nr:immunoglobulin heavy chain junction region [Macaca mulatta]
CSTEDCW